MLKFVAGYGSPINKITLKKCFCVSFLKLFSVTNYFENRNTRKKKKNH